MLCNNIEYVFNRRVELEFNTATDIKMLCYILTSCRIKYSQFDQQQNDIIDEINLSKN